METKVALPDSLKEQAVLSFCEEACGVYIGRRVVDLLKSEICRNQLGEFQASEELTSSESLLRSFWPSKAPGIFTNFKDQRTLKALVASSEPFLAEYEKLIRDVICPHLVHIIMQGGEATRPIRESGTIEFSYQFPPTLRIQKGNDVTFRRLHDDREYGHQDGEVNFWMPLTDYSHTQTTLWVESAPGKEDYRPVEINYGEIVRFHGTTCKHHVPANSSPFTRISMDFRVGIGACFDKEFEPTGVKLIHGRRLHVVQLTDS